MQSNWEEFYKNHNYFHLEPHASLPGFLNECRKHNIYDVVDLGCGAGADLLYMAEQGFNVTGVDFSPSAASNAEDLLQSKGLEGKVYVDNLFDSITGFEAGSFKAVVAINAFEYTDLAGFKRAIADVARILDSKGLFLLVVASTETKVDNGVAEQLFFNADELTDLLVKRFDILDFARDDKQNLVSILQKINH
jgi:cyclopropane fatty-acyl-phospholipid synthase-like methyltransferase